MGKFILNGISFLLVPLGIIGFALQIYFETKNILHLIFFSIGFLFYLLLLAVIYRLRHAIKERENTIKKQEKITKELWAAQDEIFKAVSLVLKSDPFFEDNAHRYSLIEINYFVKNTDGYATMHLKGKNVSGKVSDHIKIRIAGDSPIDNVRTLNLYAKDKFSDEEIHNEIIKEIETMHFKPHRIYFKNPLAHGGDFDVEITYKWPGAFTRQSDYAFFILHSYKKGVDNFKSKIEFDFKPGLIRLYEIQKERESFISGPLVIPINQKDNSLNLEVPAPTKSLLLQWTPFLTK